MKKIVALASDHAGFELKEGLKKYVQSLGYDTIDLGPDNGEESISYAKKGKELAEYVDSRKPDFGIAVCGTGLGISYALNRHLHIRAARINSVEDAKLAKLHNNANVLCFGGRQVKLKDAQAMVDEFINTKFEGGRHQSRIDELDN
ncbi:ribose 5-phosphate isomerase B [Mycoplasmopsis anatis]|uniref:Ribose 5-phosphate isomerase B n=1 Tax=Mycoplasmopsis anatis TaxID=171279 RepID=A0A9Q3QEF3_9BACT|nr:RpiB/LacA/LacB family sugar-phosphate isomerase [Mycoplasmopsis anatis]MBW0594807.1 ribose 5-phosphate isomerase B [Mycoplasmopsis anatis]MBW0595417.1 ribose 5-phosphate isomerase B [Mycoplasmopsis anatis]MBW0595840.1 ribose 5-phosphate isomerase B [Mycoplasmopsis anatis]MBW0596744.1 ribose 5-phosphate isomerase B [Mycoplasmopsis anatis]MBW0597241.1 ribose 5-phosphate isomerase B [Mycoplasmopsis anatis]